MTFKPSMNLAALIALWNVTQQHIGTSGARAAAGVLLGLYNGERFPFDLTDLRVLDPDNLAHAVAVIGCDAARCELEVHSWLNAITGRTDFGQRFEHLAHEWRRKGRCKREGLEPLSPARFLVKVRAEPAAAKMPFCNVCGEEHAAPVCTDDFPEPGDIRESA